MRQFIARVLGRGRSQRYARAVRESSGRAESGRVTERLDAVYGGRESLSGLDDALTTLQSLSLPDEDWR